MMSPVAPRPRIDDTGIVRPWTPIVILLCAPAFATTLGAAVALLDCFIVRRYLHANPWLWWWQCRDMVIEDLEEAFGLGVVHGILFATFAIARTRLCATIDLAMRCFGCGIGLIAIAVPAGAAIGWLLGRFAPVLWGWPLPPVPQGIDAATFGALNGTGGGGYVGAAAALALSCLLLHQRWRAIGILSSRGFPVIPLTRAAAAAASRPRPAFQIT